MVNISDFIFKHKQFISNDNELQLLLYKNLSQDDVQVLSMHLLNECLIDNERIQNLDMYTYHSLYNDSFGPSFRLQCSAYNVYVQHQKAMSHIDINKNTTIYYNNNNLYLVTNRIITATGIITNNTISWSNKITFSNDCFMNLHMPDNLPNNNDILSAIILNNLK
jgi:hypothetical protein